MVEQPVVVEEEQHEEEQQEEEEVEGLREVCPAAPPR
jgi:hypothetical protein